MDRWWFLTWTTYGTWLPGDRRSFVSPIRGDTGEWELHNTVGTPYEPSNKDLERWAECQLKGDVIFLTAENAQAVFDQLGETAKIRGWHLAGVAMMSNHVHLVVGVWGDPDPSDLLRDFKSYASGRLNREWPKPKSGTWWTESGSKRKLSGESAIAGALQYLREQANPLLIWIRGETDQGELREAIEERC